MIRDHLAGFTHDLQSWVLDEVVRKVRFQNLGDVYTGYVFDCRISAQYPDINFFYYEPPIGGQGWGNLNTYKIHPTQQFQNFVCSFNGSDHVGRKLLTAIPHRFDWFNPETCSKNYDHLQQMKSINL